MTDLGSLGPVRLPRLPFMPRTESERNRDDHVIGVPANAALASSFTIEWGRGLIVTPFSTRHADDGSPCAGPKCPDHKHLKWAKPRKRTAAESRRYAKLLARCFGPMTEPAR